MKLSFSIAQLGTPIPNVLFLRSGSSKYNSLTLNINYEGKRRLQRIRMKREILS